MRAIDTNVLVRILTRDQEAEALAVDRLLEASMDEAFFVPVTVVLEIEWVLRSVYGRSRPERSQAFNALLANAALSIEQHEALEVALDMFENIPRTDLADCIHVALCAVSANGPHGPLVTFDRLCARLPGTQRLEI